MTETPPKVFIWFYVIEYVWPSHNQACLSYIVDRRFNIQPSLPHITLQYQNSTTTNEFVMKFVGGWTWARAESQWPSISCLKRWVQPKYMDRGEEAWEVKDNSPE